MRHSHFSKKTTRVSYSYKCRYFELNHHPQRFGTDRRIFFQASVHVYNEARRMLNCKIVTFGKCFPQKKCLRSIVSASFFLTALFYSQWCYMYFETVSRGYSCSLLTWSFFSSIVLVCSSTNLNSILLAKQFIVFITFQLALWNYFISVTVNLFKIFIE